ncbi:MAG: zinc-ribbon domain-containing protein, partial [Nitrospinales bacterium]
MKVQCSGCKANYRINDDKIPAAGAKMKCPRCQKIIEVAKPAIVQNSPVLQPTKENTAKTGRAKSESRQYTEKKAQKKAWALMSATVVGFVALCLALGIPIKNDKKPERKEIPEIVMPFNFANDKLTEFKYFIETMEQKWGTHPADLLNFQDYPAPDEYGHSQYGVEENDLIVEFFFFFNQLYQSTINTQNSDDAKRWVEYLDSNFGEKKTDGKFYIWRNDDLNIAYVSESNQYQFHFIHTETYAERKKYRGQFGSKLVKFEVFKKIIDNEMNWAVTTDNWYDSEEQMLGRRASPKGG